MNFSGPTDDVGYAESSFVEVSFSSSKMFASDGVGVGFEKALGIFFVVEGLFIGAIVAAKKNDGVVGDACLI